MRRRGARRLSLSLGLLLAGVAQAMGPFERNHPLVEEGVEAYRAGDYQRALERFDAAKRELPYSGAVELNRGSALYKLGRLEEARSVFRALSETQDPSLRQSDLYNLGNTLVGLGDRDGAIAAYRKALRLNPADADARHNLELLVSQRPPPSPGRDGGLPDGGSPPRPDGGRDAGVPDGGGGDGGGDGGDDGGSDGGTSGDGGSDGGADGGQAPARADSDGGGGDGGDSRPEQADREDGGDGSAEGDGEDGGLDAGHSELGVELLDAGVDERSLDRREAEKLLDSLRASEKNLQLWRFQQKRQRRRDDKDW